MGAKLSVYTHMVLVKQDLRHMRIEWLLKIKEEVTKQLHVGFIKPVHQAEWIANVVPVTKKDRKGRMCVDFRDLKKAYPKKNFPLSHIDVLVDNTAGSALISFMDGFSGYNQIKLILHGISGLNASTSVNCGWWRKAYKTNINSEGRSG